MTFIRVMTLIFNHVHTILFLLGCVCVVVAIGCLTSFYYGLLALGVVLILIAYLINKE